jgi:hypothetical protein
MLINLPELEGIRHEKYSLANNLFLMAKDRLFQLLKMVDGWFWRTCTHPHMSPALYHLSLDFSALKKRHFTRTIQLQTLDPNPIRGP